MVLMQFWESIGAPSSEAAYLHLCAYLHEKHPEWACAAYAPGLRFLVQVEISDTE